MNEAALSFFGKFKLIYVGPIYLPNRVEQTRAF